MLTNGMQRWDPADYASTGAFVPALGAAVLELLAPRSGERILDLGCGDGTLTEKLSLAGARVVGVDADAAMLGAARGRGLDARLMDGELLTFDREFDAVFTNAALHWMQRPALVAAGVFRALRPGGRYVGELGGRGNVAAIRTAVRAVLLRRGYPVGTDEMQWYPSTDEFRVIHVAAGFVDVHADLIYRPTPLPTGLAAWLATFRGGYFDAVGVAPQDRPLVIAEIEDLARPVLSDVDGWMADYVRLRFSARRPT